MGFCIVGLSIMLTYHNVFLIILGSLCVLLGIYIFLWIGILCLNMHVYKFVHYYLDSNHLRSETRILNKLSKSEVTQLKKYNKDIFNTKYILVESKYPLFRIASDTTKVIGYVNATSKKDALRILKQYDFRVESYTLMPE